MANETAFAGKHVIAPLPFDPTKSKGLSERAEKASALLQEPLA